MVVKEWLSAALSATELSHQTHNTGDQAMNRDQSDQAPALSSSNDRMFDWLRRNRAEAGMATRGVGVAILQVVRPWTPG